MFPLLLTPIALSTIKDHQHKSRSIFRAFCQSQPAGIPTEYLPSTQFNKWSGLVTVLRKPAPPSISLKKTLTKAAQSSRRIGNATEGSVNGQTAHSSRDPGRGESKLPFSVAFIQLHNDCTRWARWACVSTHTHTCASTAKDSSGRGKEGGKNEEEKGIATVRRGHEREAEQMTSL